MSFESHRYTQYSTYCTEYASHKHSWEKEIHVHTVEELLLITGQGSCTVISNGNTVELQAPVFIWNRIGSFHVVTHLDEGLTVRVATFNPHIFTQYPQQLLRTDYLKDHAFFAVPLNDAHTERMLLLFRTLFSSPQFQRQLILPCIFHQISLFLTSGTIPICFGETDNYIFDVIKLLQTQESGRITIPELAARFNVGTTKLKNDFKRITSQTIHNYQLDLRHRAACRLLASTKLPLAQIAVHCGFTDESHLIRSFRKHAGKTPTAFRAEYKKRWTK